MRFNFKHLAIALSCLLLFHCLHVLWIVVARKLARTGKNLQNIETFKKSSKFTVPPSKYPKSCGMKPSFYTEIGSQAKTHPGKLKHVVENLEYKYNMYSVRKPSDATIIWTWPSPFDMQHVISSLNSRHYLNHLPGTSPFIIKEEFVINFDRDYKGVA